MGCTSVSRLEGAREAETRPRYAIVRSRDQRLGRMRTEIEGMPSTAVRRTASIALARLAHYGVSEIGLS